MAPAAAAPRRLFHPPELAALGAAAAACAVALATDGAAGGWPMHLNQSLLVLAFPLTLLVGLLSRPAPGLVACLAFAAANEPGQDHLNPFVLVICVGPWLIGYSLRGRRILAGQLRERAAELDREREVFAEESVRYERARIARELHDIVAHCVSVMVVQAAAGQRLVERSPERLGETFSNISEAARQAQAEMGSLVDLLGDRVPAVGAAGLHLVEELVGRARGSGLQVTCRFDGDLDRLTGEPAAAAYRVIQEALTNALKHAPGSPVAIEAGMGRAGLLVTVHNAASTRPATGLQPLGGGHGLRGMRERAVEAGGSLDAGPLPDGGWQVTLRLPPTAPR